MGTQTNQTKLNALRERSAAIETAIARAQHERETHHAAAGIAVATDAPLPDDWHVTSSKAAASIEALEAGRRALAEEIRRFTNACALQVAKAETNRRVPALRQLESLKTQHKALLATALKRSTDGLLTTAEFQKKLTLVEQQITETQQELDEVTAHIADVSVT